MQQDNKPPPTPPTDHTPPLPAYLARHAQLGFTTDDIAALVHSIDASQPSSPPAALHLPAEIILEILHHVPIDYLLRWRLVSRALRDAIDGRVCHYHVQRAELLGYLGARAAGALAHVGDAEYERLCVLRARFAGLVDGGGGGGGGVLEEGGEKKKKKKNNNNSNGRNGSEEPARDPSPPPPPPHKPSWANTHAVFRIQDDWLHAFRSICACWSDQQQPAYVAALWEHIQQQLAWPRRDEQEQEQEQEHYYYHHTGSFGTLRWCLQLDHAVLDLGFFPPDAPKSTRGDMPLALELDLHAGSVTIAWQAMLRGFLRAETNYRRLLDEMSRKQPPTFTYSPTEDCLRAVRRMQLQESLQRRHDTKAARHLAWSLRLLPPLFGRPRDPHAVALEAVEDEAMAVLLQLRREASMTARQVAYLHRLAAEYAKLEADMAALDEAFGQFKRHLTLLVGGVHWTAFAMHNNALTLPRNPIAWSDAVIVDVEELVGKWRSQKKVMDQLKLLLTSSNLAMALPPNSFENLEEDF